MFAQPRSSMRHAESPSPLATEWAIDTRSTSPMTKSRICSRNTRRPRYPIGLAQQRHIPCPLSSTSSKSQPLSTRGHNSCGNDATTTERLINRLAATPAIPRRRVCHIESASQLKHDVSTKSAAILPQSKAAAGLAFGRTATRSSSNP